MADPAPPSYGAVVTPSAPPPDAAPPAYHAGGYAAPYQSVQPGQMPMPYPSDPPPSYQPPEHGGQPYPPQGGYPGGAYSQYPQQPGFPTQGGYQPITSQPVLHTVHIGKARWTSLPQSALCQFCQTAAVTSISYKPGSLTWLAGGLICIFGCWAGCCLIPFCMPDLQDVEHRCSNCNQYLGAYMRL